MSDDLSLFGGNEPATPPARKFDRTPIADWQIDLLRKALDSRHLSSMSERQQAIEAAAGRSVESLRALTHEEALRVLSQLGQQPSGGRRGKSSWDDREEDTWIDRL